MELDPDLAAGHCALATIAFSLEWDWESAEPEFRRALELDPGYVWGHQVFALAWR